MKKLVSVLLTFAMLFALMPLTVFATTEGTEGLEYTLSDDETYYIVSGYTGSATGIVIPSTYNGLPVKEIGGGVFNPIRNLQGVEIPYSVTTIGTCAFYNCDSMTTVTIPDSVTTMGYEAFGACDGLLDIYCTAKVQPEGWNENWNAYTSATIHWGYGLKDGILYELSNDGTYYIVSDYTGSATEVVIPSEYNGLPVKEIGDSVFKYQRYIKTVEISDSVTTIGDYAFSDCYGLTTVKIGNSVTTIGDYAFYLCRELTNVTIGDSVTTIGNSAFDSCLSLTSIDIPDSVTTIGDMAFFECEKLTNVEIGNSLTTIGYRAFSFCENLATITVDNANEVFHSVGNCLIETETKTLALGCKNSVIPSDGSVTRIGEWAFSGCTGLTNIKIPDSVTTLSDYAFHGCTGLTSATVGNSVKTIGGYAFYSCTSLPSIKLPDSVTTIGEQAFGCCYSLTSFEIPNSVTEISELVFFDCSSLTSVKIPNSVTTICSGAFFACSSLTSIVIPNSVTTIYQEAFPWCSSLTNVKIPASVTTIGKWIFYYCENITDIYCEAKSKPAGWDDGWCNDLYDEQVATVHWGYKPAPVKITTQPKSVSVQTGKTAKVTVTATGDGLKYKWYFKNKGASSFSLTTTFTGNTYSATMDSTRAGRQVYCVITDKYGNSVKTNTVTLGMAVKITTQPKTVAVQSGKTAKVTVTATGDGLKYKWYFKNKGDTKFSLTTTFTGNTYSAEMNSTRAGRQVYCVITDKYGNSVKTNTVTLGIAVKITTQPKTVAVQSGKTAKVTVTATGDGLKYKWYFKNKGASSFSLTTTFTGNTYSAEMNSTRAGRQVYCVITDKYGNKVQTNTVTLGMAVKITTQPTSVKVANGKTAKVTVKASGDGLTYKWYFKDKGASKFSLTNTFKGATYSATMTNARAGRQVYCVITDKYGNSVKINTVTLNKK